ncbi:hypothetical protein [Christiangramia fulva]|uniref:NADH-quinone oxidoreductase subunit D-related protein n=1 Tax=Christiangramia fulva TaxID=2126553 RepID=UPI00131B1330|nr:hypothetical protein [Christiangramia fulva]
MNQLKIFPVPGQNLLALQGLDFYKKGVKIVASPRHANLLLVSAPFSKNLREAAAISYAQMPRPRILVSIDLQDIDPLPNPDLVISADELNELPAKLKKINLWSGHSKTYKPSFLVKALEDEEESTGHSNHDHKEQDDDHKNSHKHENHDQNEDEKESGDEKEEGGKNDDSNGFMSMVMMTKDMPRAADGLPMDMNEGRFDPFHPGLQDGLRIKMMLDGDTVKMATYEKGLLSRNLFENIPENPADLPEFLSQIDPLQPEAYRQLARRALQNPADNSAYCNVAVLERERLIYHLLQIQTLLQNIGDREMGFRIHKCLIDFLKNSSEKGIKKNIEQLKKRLYLKTRLKNCARIPEMFLHHISGPIARAAGKMDDHRLEDPNYDHFEAIVLNENNAWGHLLVRLEEIKHSLELIGTFSGKDNTEKSDKNGLKSFGDHKGTAKIETATGTACLSLKIKDGGIIKIKLSTPSLGLAAMIPRISMQEELSDVLAGIASLGISPWEIDK